MTDALQATNQLMRALADYSGFFLVVLTGLYVVLTALYVYFTYRIVAANRQTLEQLREQTWQANRAYVLPRLTFQQKFICVLHIANSGKTPAHNVKLELDRDLFEFGEKAKRINNIPLFSETMQVMPPGTEYYVYLWSGLQEVGESIPTEFKVTAAYETLGRMVREATTLHVGIYSGQQFPPRALEDTLERSLKVWEEQQRTLDKIRWRFDEFARAEIGNLRSESLEELKTGLFPVRVTVCHPVDRDRFADVELHVGTRAVFSWVPREVLDHLDAPRLGRRVFVIDGRPAERETAAIVAKIERDEAHVTVVAAEPGDGYVLGASTLETLGLAVDPMNLRLVPRNISR